MTENDQKDSFLILLSFSQPLWQHKLHTKKRNRTGQHTVITSDEKHLMHSQAHTIIFLTIVL